MGALLVRHEPTSAATVRNEIAADLIGRGFGAERIGDVLLVASELVTNAVQHSELSSAGGLDIGWTIVEPDITVSVADSNADEPALRAAAVDAPNGRGLAIVDALSTEWGVDRLDAGKRVWARVPIGNSVGQAAHHA